MESTITTTPAVTTNKQHTTRPKWHFSAILFSPVNIILISLLACRHFFFHTYGIDFVNFLIAIFQENLYFYPIRSFVCFLFILLNSHCKAPLDKSPSVFL